MNEVSNNQGLAVREKPVESVMDPNGGHAVVATKDLDIAKLVSKEQPIEEEKFLSAKETAVE